VNQLNQLTVVVNGDRLTVAPGSTIADVVALLTEGAEAKGIAVAVDRAVVPRSEWPSTLVRAGSQVEVVTAAAGG
jgi:sulfur carrier protein